MLSVGKPANGQSIPTSHIFRSNQLHKTIKTHNSLQHTLFFKPELSSSLTSPQEKKSQTNSWKWFYRDNSFTWSSCWPLTVLKELLQLIKPIFLVLRAWKFHQRPPMPKGNKDDELVSLDSSSTWSNSFIWWAFESSWRPNADMFLFHWNLFSQRQAPW